MSKCPLKLEINMILSWTISNPCIYYDLFFFQDREYILTKSKNPEISPTPRARQKKENFKMINALGDEF